MTSNQEEDDCDDGIVNHDEIISPLLRRGRRITDDTRSSEESEESEEEGEVWGQLFKKNCRTPPRAMASDRSLSSASPSSRAPRESPCLAIAGAGSSCTTQWLLQSRSARPRERFSDLLTMIGGTTNLFGGVLP